MKPRDPRDILEFIDSQRLRKTQRDKKLIYVKWLVNQYELTCGATVIKSKENKDANK